MKKYKRGDNFECDGEIWKIVHINSFGITANVVVEGTTDEVNPLMIMTLSYETFIRL